MDHHRRGGGPGHQDAGSIHALLAQQSVMQAVHQPANRDMLAERVELLQRDLVTLASKMRAAGERPLDLSQAESLSKLMYSRLIEFSKFARDLPSEKEESISGWARQKLMLKGLGRHKKILLG